MSTPATETPASPTIPATQPAASTATQETPQTDQPVENSVLRYVFIGVLSVALIFLIYYAYNRFVANSLAEPMTKGTEQERDDPVVDFNLREAIKHLNSTQKRILSTLSDVTDI